MIHALKPSQPEPAKKTITNALDNPAVAHCSQIWDRVFTKFSRRKDYQEEQAVAQADHAYRMAMPPLVGYENICDFIACVGYGILADVFVEGQGTKLLYAAQVALSAGSTGNKKTRKDPKSEPIAKPE